MIQADLKVWDVTGSKWYLFHTKAKANNGIGVLTLHKLDGS